MIILRRLSLSTLLHEVLHTIHSLVGSFEKSPEERSTRAIELLLPWVLRDNPQLEAMTNLKYSQSLLDERT